MQSRNWAKLRPMSNWGFDLHPSSQFMHQTDIKFVIRNKVRVCNFPSPLQPIVWFARVCNETGWHAPSTLYQLPLQPTCSICELKWGNRKPWKCKVLTNVSLWSTYTANNCKWCVSHYKNNLQATLNKASTWIEIR